MKRIALFAFALGWFCFSGSAVAGNVATNARPWQVGTPIVTYWAGPAMTDATAIQMKEGGWNLVWCKESELDTVQRHGLRGQLTDPLLAPESLSDPAKKEQLKARMNRAQPIFLLSAR
jgi:hypothetical protein